MSTYNHFTGISTGVANGRGVPRCHLSKRLDLAAAGVLGWTPLQPSITQAVRDYSVPRAALKQRIKRFRALEASGNGPAVAPAVEAANTEETSDATIDTTTVTVTPVAEETNGSAPDAPGYPVDVEAIITGLLSATPEQRAKVARELGCDWCWEQLILPIVRVERASNT
jgi:hypothetical protein